MSRRSTPVDRVGVDERAAQLGRRSIKAQAKEQGIRLAIAALDLKPGDEVLLSSSTNIATALAIIYANAVPVPVDSERETRMTPSHIMPMTSNDVWALHTPSSMIGTASSDASTSTRRDAILGSPTCGPGSAQIARNSISLCTTP